MTARTVQGMVRVRPGRLLPVEMLYRIYAHCIDGDDERWHKRMEDFLG